MVSYLYGIIFLWYPGVPGVPGVLIYFCLDQNYAL